MTSVKKAAKFLFHIQKSISCKNVVTFTTGYTPKTFFLALESGFPLIFVLIFSVYLMILIDPKNIYVLSNFCHENDSTIIVRLLYRATRRR